ncbi:GrpB family protein [Gracilibacillus salitolerans]|uniref:GrpB family protein n=1 Tax=Gracilibacillus salitolerans TaxID=2663022 RepID=A0A5Q2TL24_9BACI|nr:GrpB family protein [Gracilibacillus salitolerans]QGH35669.1 GrpB family protein [Gracilibacillus salitolerans]
MTKSIVNICDYNPKWKEQFDTERNRIIDVLGDKIVGIEHIGSTSIKGLAAKPIIDILVGVQNLDKVDQFVNPLKEIEYEYVPKPDFKDRKFFRKGEWGKGTSHLHICEYDSSEWIEKLLFRDYLRLHPEAAQEYEVLKKSLACEYKYDRQTYTKKKEPFIKNIVEKAKKE